MPADRARVPVAPLERRDERTATGNRPAGGREGRVLVRGVEHRAVHEDGPRRDGEIDERDLAGSPEQHRRGTLRPRDRFESGGDALGVECRRADRDHRNGAELVGHEQRDGATGRDDLVGLGANALGGEARRLLLARVDGIVRDEAERDAGRAQRLDGFRRARNGVIAYEERAVEVEQRVVEARHVPHSTTRLYDHGRGHRTTSHGSRHVASALAARPARAQRMSRRSARPGRSASRRRTPTAASRTTRRRRA